MGPDPGVSLHLRPVPAAMAGLVGVYDEGKV